MLFTDINQTMSTYYLHNSEHIRLHKITRSIYSEYYCIIGNSLNDYRFNNRKRLHSNYLLYFSNRNNIYI